jgi:mono/diheme cytochrome c family protein
MKRILWGAGVVLALTGATITALLLSELYGDSISIAPGRVAATQEQIARGEYLARLGNCAGCHTARGGEPYAGGKAIATPFGSIYASNLTPDKAAGIGAWGPNAFYRAMHEGRSIDGRLLYPAFPYPNMTRVTREDSDAIFAYLMHGVKPVSQANLPNTLSFPFNSQLALAAWRILYFKPDPYRADAAQSAQWNRGSYLVQGLTHCGACHSTRNALGAPVAGHAYDGAMMPLNDWYAPSLTARHEASVADWDVAQIAQWLRSGSSETGSALGPMADVIFQSTQYASNEDLMAMSTYLKSLPVVAPTPVSRVASSAAASDGAGLDIYREHCASCHGKDGKGKPGAFPALAGNRTVTMANTTNLIRIILSGGFAPATADNPRPYGMPPYYHVLSDADIARVATYIRTAWGNGAPAVTELDMVKHRNALGTAH